MVEKASLNRFVEAYEIIDYGDLSRDYEVARLLADTEAGDRIPRFRVKGAETVSVGNVVSTRERLYNALRVDSDVEAYEKILAAESNPRPLKWVGIPGGYRRASNGLFSLPAAKFYERDGGYYLTAGLFIACRKSICNASIHRVMVLGEDKAAVRLVPRHLYRMYTEAVEDEGRLPVTIVLGVHPAVLIASSTSPKYGVFELEVASQLMDGLEVFPSPIHGNPVPVGAGAIVEGYLVKERVEEGPFADILLLYDRVRKEPLLVVEDIYISDRYTHVILSGGMEHVNLMGFPREAQIWAAVSRVVPRVHKVRLTPGGGGWLNAVIVIEKSHDGDGKNAIMAAFAGHPSLKHVVVVDPDIDPDDPRMVEWAIATRFRADRDLVIVSNVRGSTLDPTGEEGYTAKMGVDATRPRKGDEKFDRARIPR